MYYIKKKKKDKRMVIWKNHLSSDYTRITLKFFKLLNLILKVLSTFYAKTDRITVGRFPTFKIGLGIFVLWF